MAFKFKDLIVTLDHCGSSRRLDWCGSSKDIPEPCGSSRKYDVACLDSAEVLTQTPYALIDPHYQQELREMLLYALTMSKVTVSRPTQLEVLNERMTPRTPEEIEGLERRLLGALKELRELKRKAPARARGTRAR